MGKSKAQGTRNVVPIVPAVSIVPNVQFRFMSKIDDEAPKSASCVLSFNTTESLPWRKK